MPLNNTDAYKISHEKFMHGGTEMIYSNFTPRSPSHAPVLSQFFDGRVVLFGLQHFILTFLIKEWNEEFFDKPKEDVLAKFKRRLDAYLGPDAVSFEHFEELHDLGYLPLEIKALPEGSKVPIGVPMFTIHNTDDRFAWLTNYLETVISCEIWKPCTSATIADQYRLIMEHWATKTGCTFDHIPFQCHDFSFRGMSGRHDAALSGAAHLLSFAGTDTIPAIDLLEDSYFADVEKELVGASVPASEHSVTSLGSSIDGEFDTIKRWITEDYPTGIVSVVSDTYDFWKVLTEYLPKLKDDILARKPNALGMSKVVIRPDSGDPEEIICGTVKYHFKDEEEALGFFEDQHYTEAKEDCEGSYNVGSEEYSDECTINGEYYIVTTPFEYDRHDKEFYYISHYSSEGGIPVATKIEVSPDRVGALSLLWKEFGGTINEAGYKELDPHIGLIYGDSITMERANSILANMERQGFAASNVVFGIGSFTYQYVTRDTFGFAMKATAAMVDGKPKELFKDPVTDDGTKKSAKGFLSVRMNDDGVYQLYDQVPYGTPTHMNTVFLNGVMVTSNSFSGVKKVMRGL